MSFPWWKTAPTPVPEVAQGPWAAEAPNEFSATTMRCSADGCAFQGSDFVTAALGPGVRPYCQHHATGGELKVRDLLWKLPCACGKVADGFQQVVGDFSAVHSERKCIVRTIQAAPEDVTVPLGSPVLDTGRSAAPREHGCACGKRADGTVSSANGFTEWHAVRECIEQTVKAPGEEHSSTRAPIQPPGRPPTRPMMSGDPADALLLVGANTIEDLLSLRAAAPAGRSACRCSQLAAALARAAAEGQVPESYVADALKATRKMADVRESKPH